MSTNYPSDHLEPDQGAEYCSDALSPVSPKPLRFPSPMSIPVLENMMDPVFNDTSTHAESSATPQSMPQAHQKSPATEQGLSANSGTDNPDNDSGDSHTVEAGSSPYSLPASSLEPSNQPAAQNQISASNYIERSDQSSLSAHTSVNDPGRQTSEQALNISPPQDSTKAISQPSDHASAFAAQSRPFDQAIDSESQIPGDKSYDERAANEENSEALRDLLRPATEAHAPPVPNDPGATSQVAWSHGAPAVSTHHGADADDQPMTASFAHSQPDAPSIPSLANPTSLSADSVPSIPPHIPNPWPRPAFANETSTVVDTGAPGTSLPVTNELPAPPGLSVESGLTQLATPSDPPPFAIGGLSSEVVSPADGNLEFRDSKWGPEIQRQYDSFLQFEEDYVKKGDWTKFPANSRLFVGNLSSEKITKRDLFHVFHKHGQIAQISIKTAFGFVQFVDAHDASEAKRKAQGMVIRGKKINIEFCKSDDQGGDGDAGRRNRSRSPDFERGRNRSDSQRGRNQNRRRERDSYRPGRSASPRSRGADRYDGRRRSRSPLRAVQTPRLEDEFARIPPRTAAPDVQAIAGEDVDLQYLYYVRQLFESRQLRFDTLRVHPRNFPAAVDNQSQFVALQMLEGVQAILKIDRMSQQTQTARVLLFDRTDKIRAQHTVFFTEMQNIPITYSIDYVLRSRQAHEQQPPNGLAPANYMSPSMSGQAAFGQQSSSVPPMNSYGPPSSYVPPGPQPQHHPQPPAQAPSQETSGGVDNNTLQRILNGLSQSSSYQQQAPQSYGQPSGPYGSQHQQNHSADFSKMYGSPAAQPQPGHSAPQQYGQMSPQYYQGGAHSRGPQ